MTVNFPVKVKALARREYPSGGVVLVYNNVSTATGTITSDPNLSVRITSSTYPELFEIESCVIEGGTLWFNCNRKTDANDTLTMRCAISTVTWIDQ